MLGGASGRRTLSATQQPFAGAAAKGVAGGQRDRVAAHGVGTVARGHEPDPGRAAATIRPARAGAGGTSRTPRAEGRCGGPLPTCPPAESLLGAQRCRTVLSVCVEVCSAAFYLDDDPGVLVSACLF